MILAAQAQQGGGLLYDYHDGRYLRYHVVVYDSSSAEKAEGNP